MGRLLPACEAKGLPLQSRACLVGSQAVEVPGTLACCCCCSLQGTRQSLCPYWDLGPNPAQFSIAAMQPQGKGCSLHCLEEASAPAPCRSTGKWGGIGPLHGCDLWLRGHLHAPPRVFRHCSRLPLLLESSPVLSPLGAPHRPPPLLPRCVARLQEINVLGRRIARNLTLNYFDHEDISARHVIRHKPPEPVEEEDVEGVENVTV